MPHICTTLPCVAGGSTSYTLHHCLVSVEGNATSFSCASRNRMRIPETFVDSQIGLRNYSIVLGYSQVTLCYSGSSHLYVLGISCVVPKLFEKIQGYSQGVPPPERKFSYANIRLWEFPLSFPNPLRKFVGTSWNPDIFSINYSATAEFPISTIQELGTIVL